MRIFFLRILERLKMRVVARVWAGRAGLLAFERMSSTPLTRNIRSVLIKY